MLPAIVFLLFNASKQKNTLLHSSLDLFFGLVTVCVAELQTAYTWCLQGTIEVGQLLNALRAPPPSVSPVDAKIAGQYVTVLKALVGHMRPPKTEEYRRGVSASEKLLEGQRRQVISNYFRDHIVCRLFELVMDMASKPDKDTQGMLRGFHGIGNHQQEAIFGLLEILLAEPAMAAPLCQGDEPVLARLVDIMRLPATQASYGKWHFKKLFAILSTVFEHRSHPELSATDKETMIRVFEHRLVAPLMEFALDLSDNDVKSPLKTCLIDLIQCVAKLCGDATMLRRLCQAGHPAELVKVIHALRRPRGQSSLKQADVKALLGIFRCVVKHRRDSVIIDYLDTVLLSELLALCGDIPKQEFSGAGSQFPKTVYECTVGLAKDAVMSKMLCKNDDLFNIVIVLKGNASSDIDRETIALSLIDILASGAMPILPFTEHSQLLKLTSLFSWTTLVQSCGPFQHEDTPVDAHKTITSTYQHSLLPAMLDLLVESYTKDEGHRLLADTSPRIRLADTCAALYNLSNVALEAVNNPKVVVSLEAILQLIEDTCFDKATLPVKPTRPELLALMRVLFGFVRHAAATARADSFLATRILPSCMKLAVSAVQDPINSPPFLRGVVMSNFGPFEVLRLCTSYPLLANLCCTVHSKELTKMLDLFLKTTSLLHPLYQWMMYPIANLCSHSDDSDIEALITATLLPIALKAMTRLFEMETGAEDPNLVTTLVAQFCLFPAAAGRMATEIPLGRCLPDAIQLLDKTRYPSRHRNAIPHLLSVLVSLMKVVECAPEGDRNAAQITRYLGRDVGNAIFNFVVTRLKAEDAADDTLMEPLCLPAFMIVLTSLVETCSSAVIAEELCQHSDNLTALMRVLMRGTATQADADTLNVQFWGQQHVSKEQLLELVAWLYSSICQWCHSEVVASAIFRTQPIPTLLKILERDY